MKMSLKDHIMDKFSDLGYGELSQIPRELTYVPELILSKDNTMKIFHLKDDSESLRDSIIQRIGQAKKVSGKTYEQYLVFNKKPKQGILKSCRLYGLGIFYLNADATLTLYTELYSTVI